MNLLIELLTCPECRRPYRDLGEKVKICRCTSRVACAHRRSGRVCQAHALIMVMRDTYDNYDDVERRDQRDDWPDLDKAFTAAGL